MHEIIINSFKMKDFGSRDDEYIFHRENCFSGNELKL